MKEAFSLRGGISSVLYAEGVYYAFGAEKKSLIRFTSTDLIRWKRGKVIYRAKNNIGATAAYERNGRIYLLFASGENVLLVVSDRAYQEFEFYPRPLIINGKTADLSVVRSGERYLLTTGSQDGIRVWSSYNLMDWTFAGERFAGIGRTVSPCFLKSDGKEYLFFGRGGGTFCLIGKDVVRVEDFPMPRTTTFPDGRMILFGDKSATLFREVRFSDDAMVFPLAERIAFRREQWSLNGLRFQKKGCLPDMPDAPAEYTFKVELDGEEARFRMGFFENYAGGIYFHYNADEGVAVLDASFFRGAISARKLNAGQALDFTVRTEGTVFEVSAEGASFSASLPYLPEGRGMSVSGEGGAISITAFRIKNQEE